MKVGKAIKKIEKYLGVEVQYDGCRYWFQYENEVGSFLPNGHRGGMNADAMEADACNWHTILPRCLRSMHPHMTSATLWWLKHATVTQASPPEVGCLIECSPR